VQKYNNIIVIIIGNTKCNILVLQLNDCKIHSIIDDTRGYILFLIKKI